MFAGPATPFTELSEVASSSLSQAPPEPWEQGRARCSVHGPAFSILSCLRPLLQCLRPEINQPGERKDCIHVHTRSQSVVTCSSERRQVLFPHTPKIPSSGRSGQKSEGPGGRHSSDRSGDRSEIRHPTLRIDQEESHDPQSGPREKEGKRPENPRIRILPIVAPKAALEAGWIRFKGKQLVQDNPVRCPRRRDILPMTHGKSIKIEMGELICPGV